MLLLLTGLTVVLLVRLVGVVLVGLPASAVITPLAATDYLLALCLRR